MATDIVKASGYSESQCQAIERAAVRAASSDPFHTAESYEVAILTMLTTYPRHLDVIEATEEAQ